MEKYNVGAVVRSTIDNKTYIIVEVDSASKEVLVKELEPNGTMDPFTFNVPAETLDEFSEVVSDPHGRALGTLSIDVTILPDGTLDVWMSHEGCSGEHYTGVTAEYVGKLVEEDIKSTAEGNGCSCA